VKPLRLASLSLLLILTTSACSRQRSEQAASLIATTDDCTQPTKYPLPHTIPDTVSKAASQLKPGMTRADLLVSFTEDGGLSTSAQQTYVFRSCPTAKINVAFAPAANAKSGVESKNDKIVSISAPYRALMALD
jgi:hypothetical protein